VNVYIGGDHNYNEKVNSYTEFQEDVSSLYKQQKKTKFFVNTKETEQVVQRCNSLQRRVKWKLTT
jgi:hypothetical protein